MDSVPEELVQYIISHISNARDLARCSCVSKQWRASIPFVKGLFFPRNSFENDRKKHIAADIVTKWVRSTFQLEQLTVFCPFPSIALASWLLHCASSLRTLELRMDNIVDEMALDLNPSSPSKLDCIGLAKTLETLKLWGVLMTKSPKWGVLQNLKDVEIVGARLEDAALSDALKACPNLTNLLVRGCEGLKSLALELEKIKQCSLDFYGHGFCCVSMVCPKLEFLDLQGCSWIRVRDGGSLRSLSISNCSGRVQTVDFEQLGSLEFLSLRGVQWSWDSVSKLLGWASEVNHLFMKVEFTGDDFNTLRPFPDVDLVDFFSSHPNLQKLDVHGAMFAALCLKNETVDDGFSIPCLEEAVITVRSPLNAEQKLNTLEFLLKYGKRLRRLVVRLLQMKTTHSSADEFYEEICKLCVASQGIVRIE